MTLLITLLTAFADDTTPPAEVAASTERTEYESIRGSCPSYAPVKGNLTPYTTEYCIFHIPSGLYYFRTDAECCFVSSEAATTAGCRKSAR
ncbi:MAG: hypothetical protein ACI8RZ_001848 [Myxococcota bacterium]|jgi:hypothetical protein